MPRKRKLSLLELLPAAIFPALAFVGGMIASAFSFYSNMADKPYVDKSFEAGRKYTDDKSSAVLKEAFEHSDMNRQLMMLELKEYGGQLSGLSIKMDMVVDSIKQMNSDFRHKR